MEILKSATKIVLLMIVFTVMVCTIWVVFYNLSDKDTVVAILWVFSSAVMLVLWFYFWQKVALSANNNNG